MTTLATPTPTKPTKPTKSAVAQYNHFKKQHRDCVLFFRNGDFYDLHFADAELVHQTTGVKLTASPKTGSPLVAVPYNSVEVYIRKIIEAGHRCAVCEVVAS